MLLYILGKPLSTDPISTDSKALNATQLWLEQKWLSLYLSLQLYCWNLKVGEGELEIRVKNVQQSFETGRNTCLSNISSNQSKICAHIKQSISRVSVKTIFQLALPRTIFPAYRKSSIYDSNKLNLQKTSLSQSNNTLIFKIKSTNIFSQKEGFPQMSGKQTKVLSLCLEDDKELPCQTGKGIQKVGHKMSVR